MERLLSRIAGFCAVPAALFLLGGCIDPNPAPPAFEVVKIVPPTPAVPPAPGTPPLQSEIKPVPVPPSAPSPAAPAAEPKEKKPETAQLTTLLPPNGETKRFLSDAAFLTKWNILGPFKLAEEETANGKAPDSIHKEFVTEEKKLDGRQDAPQNTCWQLKQFKEEEAPGQVKLSTLFPDTPGGAGAYAIAYLDSPEELSNLVLYAGGSDFLKIWINGKLIHTYNREPRSSHWDQDVIEGVQLNKGFNLVIVKTVTLDSKVWSFYLRLTDKDGLPVCAAP